MILQRTTGSFFPEGNLSQACYTSQVFGLLALPVGPRAFTGHCRALRHHDPLAMMRLMSRLLLSGEHSTVHPGTMTHRRRSILSCKRLPPCRNAPAGSPHPLCSSPHDEKLWHTPTRWSRYDATCVSREHSTVRPGMMTPVSLHHDAMYPPSMMPYRDDVPTYRYLARELLCIVEPCTHTLSSSRRLKSTMKE